jgi:hypothetical protein
LAFEARALSSFSNDSLVRRGAFGGGTIGGFDGLEEDERVMLGVEGVKDCRGMYRYISRRMRRAAGNSIRASESHYGRVLKE